jgi:hypothetical protein
MIAPESEARVRYMDSLPARVVHALTTIVGRTKPAAMVASSMRPIARRTNDS